MCVDSLDLATKVPIKGRKCLFYDDAEQAPKTVKNKFMVLADETIALCQRCAVPLRSSVSLIDRTSATSLKLDRHNLDLLQDLL